MFQNVHAIFRRKEGAMQELWLFYRVRIGQNDLDGRILLRSCRNFQAFRVLGPSAHWSTSWYLTFCRCSGNWH